LQPKPIRHRRPPASTITPDTPIWCPACQIEHPASAFNRESRKHSGLHGVCREAQRRARQTAEGKASTARRNKRRWALAEYRASSVEYQRKRRQIRGSTYDLKRSRARLQALVTDWKGQGCVDCAYTDIRAIDPDHLVGEIKSGHLSRLVQLCTAADKIRAELLKCVPRCARCHRLVTQQQRPSVARAAERLPASWRRRYEFQDRNDAIKLARGCDDCGWAKWARGLDWDHVRGVKVTTIAIMIANGRPWSEIEVEMAKCELVCANCHRIRTCERRVMGKAV
jgi:hypothetical protein